MAGLLAHLDLDAFFANVELLRRPELRGLPVIVSGSGPRAVVTTASYEARAFGVRSAMPTVQARRLCPQGILVPPDLDAYRSASRAVMAVVRDHIDIVEQMGIDEAYLDITGLVTPNAALRRLVAEIRTATGLTASVGIGPNKLVAKVASDAEKPGGFVRLTIEQARERFAGASPGLIPGIGPRTVERLSAMGITTLGALGAVDEGTLAAVFGPRQGPQLAARARFEDDARVEPERAVVSESRERTFEHDVRDIGELEEILGVLTAQLCGSLRERDRRGRTVRLKLRLDDFTTVTRARTLGHATDDEREIHGTAVELLREYRPARPVRLLGVGIAGLSAGDDQLTFAL
ncbi:unannotated protein [freshwater metagenome]|uniref:DNA-directed DNA polymerase n=1 Tax=freshwater metagenome TaxID=449393 RepID=A0A6J7I2R9_9ZZZZ